MPSPFPCELYLWDQLAPTESKFVKKLEKKYGVNWGEWPKERERERERERELEIVRNIVKDLIELKYEGEPIGHNPKSLRSHWQSIKAYSIFFQ